MIRPLQKNDVNTAATIHAEAFSRQKNSAQWLACALYAYPRSLCYVIEVNNKIVGYIIWAQKSGFRHDTVLELEQIAVLKNWQNKGLGQSLIEQSLLQIKAQLALNDAWVKTILVSTRADNHAQQWYRKVLGAEVEATISGLYSADEVLMIARDIWSL